MVSKIIVKKMHPPTPPGPPPFGPPPPAPPSILFGEDWGEMAMPPPPMPWGPGDAGPGGDMMHHGMFKGAFLAAVMGSLFTVAIAMAAKKIMCRRRGHGMCHSLRTPMCCQQAAEPAAGVPVMGSPCTLSSPTAYRPMA